MVALIELYLFIPLSVTLIAFQGHSSVIVLTENFMFLFVEVETLRLCWLRQVNHEYTYLVSVLRPVSH